MSVVVDESAEVVVVVDAVPDVVVHIDAEPEVVVVVDSPLELVLEVVEEPEVVVELAEVGLGGARGEPGPRGPAGADAVGAQLELQVPSPAATWTFEHNLDAYPGLLLFCDDAPNEPVFGYVTYPDRNTAVIRWPSPESGRAYTL